MIMYSLCNYWQKSISNSVNSRTVAPAWQLNTLQKVDVYQYSTDNRESAGEWRRGEFQREPSLAFLVLGSGVIYSVELLGNKVTVKAKGYPGAELHHSHSLGLELLRIDNM